MDNDLLGALNSLSDDELLLFQEELSSIDMDIDSVYEDIKNYEEEEEETKFTAIKVCEKKEFYRASSLQTRIYTVCQLQKGSVAYNIPLVMRGKGKLDKRKLEDSIDKIINRHESFRTSFHLVDGELMQKVDESIKFKINYDKLAGASEEEIVDKHIRRFNLEQAPLIRVGIIEISSDEFIMITDMHHIIADGISVDIFINELKNLYEGESLEDLKFQYKDFSEWQNKVYKEGYLKKQEKYWMKKYDSEIPVLNMPLDFKRPQKQSFKGDRINFKINSGTSRKLRKLSLKTGATMYMLLLSIYKILLSKYSSQEDIVVGTPVAGRIRTDIQDIIGMFVNSLAIRSNPEGEKRFLDYLQEMKMISVEAFENQEYRLEDLVEKLGVKRDMSRNPLFDSMFALEDVGKNVLEFEDVKFSKYSKRFKVSKFDMTVTAVEMSDGINIQIEYCTDLFKVGTIEKIGKHFAKITEEIADNPEIKLKDVDMITEEEKEKLLKEFNETESSYDKSRAIGQMFEQQSLATPDNIAVRCGGDEVTYSQLNTMATGIAKELIDTGMSRGTIVGLTGEKSIKQIAAIIGIIRAGGIYLPIDHNYPIDRIKYMLEDSKAKILLESSKVDKDIEFNGEVISLEREWGDKEETTDLGIDKKMSDTAYMIYTSGSTGKPKGVMVSHLGIANLRHFFKTDFGIKPEDNVLQFASMSFDASVWEIFMAILTGATLDIPEKKIINDFRKFEEYINENNITVATLPPTYATHIKSDNVKSLRKLITAGSEATQKLIDVWSKKLEYVNAYGPTETTVCATTWTSTSQEDSTIPIGKPISNTKVHILDKNNKLLPIGIPGQLAISGDGLANGYLNREELTAEKFIDNPFEEGKKLYLSGDLARCLPDGNIEFLGRIDHQVKIRGFRIELGEIDSQLMKIEEIKEAITIDKEDENGDKFLVAYYTAKEELDLNEVKIKLAQGLPQYMIPTNIIYLDNMPLTQNGKIDKKELKSRETEEESSKVYVAPRDDIETSLCEVLQEVLGISRIGIDDNFFECGGDSIKSIQIASRLNKYSMKLEIKDLLSNPTVRAAAKYVVKGNKRVVSNEPVIGDVDLTPIQRWFFDKEFTDKNHWNQSMFIYRKDGFQEEKVRAIFKNIVEHHDILRAVYKVENGEVTQRNRGIEDGELFNLDIREIYGCDCCKEVIEEAAVNVQKGMDLENGPLVRLGLFKTDEGDHLLISIHHMVVDGVSWRIILEDFKLGYTQLMDGEQIQFQDKTCSYKQWTEAIKEYSETNELSMQEEYWNKITSDYEPLEGDNHVEDRKIKNSIDMEIQLSKQHTRRLLKDANRPYSTEVNDILLTALGMAMKEWRGKNKIIVNTEGHGRENITDEIDVTRTVGWFTSQYPVQLNVSETDDISRNIKVTKEAIRQIPKKGVGYQILRTRSNNQSENKREYETDVSFNYLGQFGQDAENDIFGVSQYSAGDEMSIEGEGLSKVSINGSIMKDELMFMVRYDKYEFNEDTMMRFINIYKRKLEDVIDHCSDKKNKEITPSDIGAQELSIDDFDEICKKYSVDNIKSIYRLTPMQEGMLFHSMKDEGESFYFEQLSLNVNRAVDIEVLQRSFDKLIKKYDVLRTRFVHKNLRFSQQVVMNKVENTINFKDISNLNNEEVIKYIKEYQENDISRGFDVSNDNLIKLAAIKVNDNKYKFVWSFHHIIMDGWCMGIIFEEFIETYNSLIDNKEVDLGEAIEYKKYIDWINRQDKKLSKNYWTNHLSDYSDVASVPRSNVSEVNKYIKKELCFKINEDLTKEMQQLTQKNQITMSALFQAIWAVVLKKYNDTNDVVYGSVVSGRPAEIDGIESMVGLFINTVPIRVKSHKNMEFANLAKSVNETFIETNEYSYYPLADIQSCSELKEKLLDHIMVFENYPVNLEPDDEVNDKHLEMDLNNIESYEQVNYDFNIIVGPSKEILVKFSYNENVYKESFVENISKHFMKVVDSIVDNPQIKLKDIDMITVDEKKKLLNEFNSTESYYDKSKTIDQMFEQQSLEAPNKVAVVSDKHEITYSKLNNMANAIAKELLNRGMNKGTIIGITGEKSIEQIAGIIGIIRAGGIYLPIDHSYPMDRINYMLEDSNAKILLKSSKIDENIDFNGEIISLEKEWDYNKESGLIDVSKSMRDTAYMIYTSGSTGKPKGVMVSHLGVANLRHFFKNDFGIRKEDNILQFASMSFDASVWEIFMAILTGATLKIPAKDIVNDFGKFEEYLNENSITVATLPPTYATHIKGRNVKTLRKLITAGSEATQNIIDAWSKKLEYVNAYGPTETTVCATTWTSTGEGDSVIPIGKPISNTKVHILDSNNKLLPIGVPGQLCISGDGLANGYLNREELTADKFIDNPFDKGEKLYLSGDLARWLPDGNIEFLGRIDNQVKIRGFRIEIGEVESQLREIKRVKEAVITTEVDGSGNNYLVGYFTAEEQVQEEEIKNELRAKLPEYMVPSYVIQIAEMPLTHNGKVDKKQLPKYLNSIKENTGYEKPTNDTQIKICSIWNDILDREDIGINDDFFDVGGHSLKASILVSRLFKEFGVEISIKKLFENPTVKGISKLLNEGEQKGYEAIEKADEREYYPVSSIQERMVAINNMDKESLVYNMPIVMRVQGEINIDKFEEAYRQLIDRHEALRTSFEIVNHEVKQKINENVDFSVEHIKVGEHDDEDKIIQSFVKPFNLADKTLIRVRFASKSNKEHLMMMDLHHSICDGISMDIILRDLIKLYDGKVLEKNKLQFKDYAVWQEKQVENKEVLKQEEFWMEQFKGELPNVQLPLDYKRKSVQDYQGDRLKFTVDRTITDKLNDMAKETGATLYIVLLAAYTMLMNKYTGKEDIIVGSVVSGRNHPDTQDIVGMFVNTIALRNYPASDKGIAEYIEEVKVNSVNAFENQSYDFNTLLNKISVKREVGRNPLFDTMFILQNIDMEPIKMNNLTFEQCEVPFKISKFDVTFNAVEIEEGIYLDLEYCVNLFKKETIQRMGEHFLEILKEITSGEKRYIGDIELTHQKINNKEIVDLDDLDFDF